MSGFSDSEKISYLLKKSFGKPSTNPSTEFYLEAEFDGKPAVFQTQIYSETVPTVAPADLTSLTESSNGDDGENIVGNLGGKTSTSNPMIKRYIKVPLIKAVAGNDQSFVGPSNGGDSNILASTVPFNFDGGTNTYVYQLFDYNGTSIPFGTGDWVVDPDAGVLTFYEYSDLSGAGLTVSKTEPPKISYYRYIGTKGMSSGLWTDNSTNASTIYYNASNTVVIGNTTRSSSEYSLEVNGNVKVHNDVEADTFSSVSDKRLKTNIRTLPYSLKEILKIKPILFDWLEKSKKQNDNVGVIAQELQSVMPELVSTKNKNISTIVTGEDSNNIKSIIDGKDDVYLAVQYDKISVVLINSIKQLYNISKINNKNIKKLFKLIGKSEEYIK